MNIFSNRNVFIYLSKLLPIILYLMLPDLYLHFIYVFPFYLQYVYLTRLHHCIRVNMKLIIIYDLLNMLVEIHQFIQGLSLSTGKLYI